MILIYSVLNIESIVVNGMVVFYDKVGNVVKIVSLGEIIKIKVILFLLDYFYGIRIVFNNLEVYLCVLEGIKVLFFFIKLID